MCLISLAWGVHPQYPLVIAANRDEFYNRPTAPLAAWQGASGHTIVGGRDLRDGGTWMGFTPGGRFACVTNVRAPVDEVPPANVRSRGELALAWLTSELDAPAWASTVNAQAYAGFNLIVADWHARTCLYISNRQEKTRNTNVNTAQAATNSIANTPAIRVTRDIVWQSLVGLSNAALDTPWPKTQKLKSAMANSLQGKPSQASLLEHLHAALADTQTAPQQNLPHTGITPDREQALSSAFVRYPREQPLYGTRTSLLAVLDASGGLQLQETTHADGQHNPGQVSRYSLDW